MSQTVATEWEMTEELWRAFYNDHYANDRRLKQRFVWGVILVMIGALGLGGLSPHKLVGGLVLLAGLYCVLSKHFLINKTVKKARDNPNFSGKMKIRLDIDGISGSNDSTSFNFPWTRFIGYRRSSVGWAFYVSENLFFALPLFGLSGREQKDLQDFLTANHLKALP